VERFASLHDSTTVKARGKRRRVYKTLRRFFSELEGILGKPETWTTKLE
jgi:hypothetical protein